VGIAVLAIVLGGIQSISKVSSLVVPFMAVFYFLGGVIIILVNITHLPGAIVDMFRMAFSVRAVGGGVAGTVVATMFQAMSKGVARGCFSNEAGMGSAAIAAAGATTDNYIRQGLISETGTFWDTMVVCSVTGLSILTSGVTNDITFNAAGAPELTGASLTIAAFRSVLGPVGGWLVAVALALFAFSTILGWEYYGEKSLEYLTSSTSATLVYRVLFSIVAFVGCISAFELAWNVSDVLNALMIVPNCIIIWMLGGTLVKEFETFMKEHKESL
jgi:AGCS family alanine or glycine:cation symporter